LSLSLFVHADVCAVWGRGQAEARDSRFLSSAQVQHDREKEGDLYYDTEDDFIDDEELDALCVHEARIKTKHSGFYIQKGAVAVVEGLEEALSPLPKKKSRAKGDKALGVNSKGVGKKGAVDNAATKAAKAAKAAMALQKAEQYSAAQNAAEAMDVDPPSPSGEGAAAAMTASPRKPSGGVEAWHKRGGAFVPSAVLNQAVAALKLVAEALPAPEGQSPGKDTRKKMPEALNAPLATVAALTHQQAGYIPKEMVSAVMAFLSPWTQESTLRTKMKKAASSAEPHTAPASPAILGSAVARPFLPPPEQSQDGMSIPGVSYEAAKHFVVGPELEAAIAAMRTKVATLPPPPETQKVKRLPEEVSEDFTAIAALIRRNPGFVPKQVVDPLMEFMEPYGQESTIRRKLKEYVAELNKAPPPPPPQDPLRVKQDSLKKEIARVAADTAAARAIAGAGGDEAFAAPVKWGRQVEELVHAIILLSTAQNPDAHTTKVLQYNTPPSPHPSPREPSG
jgi:hypothetical protein